MTPEKTAARANCQACLLAAAMKDCPACKFIQPMQEATSADIFRIYRQLWGDFTPDDVRYAAELDTTRELVDMTQTPEWVIGE